MADGMFGAGMYEFEWSGKNLASGCYFYTMTAGPADNGKLFVQTRKMIVAK